MQGEEQRPAQSVINSTAIFACSDVEATLVHYKEVLGFDSTWAWGEPVSFGGASIGGASIMFNLQPDLAPSVRGHEHWFNVQELDRLYRLHLQNGARIVSEIGDRPWGFREYVVEDLNGYRLRFAGPLSSSAEKSEPYPEGVVIELRLPTNEEFAAVTGEGPALLESTWGGVIARSPSGETIGVLRIMQDARGWFSIWDVAVTPAWQAKHIGSKMMEAAIARIGAASPGAHVYLFTMKHGFYERLGFAQQTVSMRQA